VGSGARHNQGKWRHAQTKDWRSNRRLLMQCFRLQSSVHVGWASGGPPASVVPGVAGRQRQRLLKFTLPELAP
jgi:hypothetical protein